MKIAIGYPPLSSKKGVPQISQNRQFQWTTGGPVSYFIYPIVPAAAASLLKEKGYRVFWLDGLAEKWAYDQWLKEIKRKKIDLIALEVKTPVIKKIWTVVDNLKEKFPKMKIVLMGDHVTALPGESFDNSKTDFVITGGDYDFLLLNIIEHLGKRKKLKEGIWYRKKNKVLNTGKFKLSDDLSQLPLINRKLSKWQLYAYKNSNFYRTPGTYTMFGRDCWWGKCTFCSWTTLFPGKCFRSFSVKRALREVDYLVNELGVKEIMDDSGTFPVGNWLRDFCQGIIDRGYQKKVRFDCNMRFNADLTKKDYQLMGKAGFRFILYGLESASQETLNRVKKNLKLSQIESSLRWAKEAGLAPHLTVMVGYPWETESDVKKTLNLAQKLFKKGLADSLQATIVIPYPGTPLFDYCKKNDLLKTLDWDRYDMSEPIMKTAFPEEKLSAAVREFYSRSIWNRRFILNVLSQLKSWDGVKYVSFQGLKYLGKLWQFR